MNVLAVVVTYNRLEMLKQCLEKIKAQSFCCDCLIVDNASTDNTAAWCDDFIKISNTGQRKFIYENTGANIGGAGGFNFGMRRACELGYDYAWIMDDDAYANHDALEKLLEADKTLGGVFSANGELNYGFLGSIVLWKDASICAMNQQRKKNGSLFGSGARVSLDDVNAAINSDKSKLIPIVTSTFVSLLIPTAVVKKVGLPIREFFIWCDDIEYTRRISTKANLPCYSVCDSQILHFTKNNVGSDLASDDKERIERYRYAIRNTVYYYKHLGFKGIVALLYFIFNSNKDLIFKAKDNKSKRFRIFWTSLMKGFSFNPEIEYLKK